MHKNIRRDCDYPRKRNMKKWILVYGSYEGSEAKAVNLLTSKAEEYLDYELAVYPADRVDPEIIGTRCVIYLGTLSGNRFLGKKYPSVADGNKQGYLYEVLQKEDGNDILIAGNTALGVYYGAVALISHYLPQVPVYQSRLRTAYNINLDGLFRVPFNVIMPEAKEECAPSIATRAIWTWGHVIFDYEKFFENMSLLRLNEIVIWNDCMPVNIREVVACAHEWGIRVILGFSWGWNTNCSGFDLHSCFDEKKVSAFAQEVLNYYRQEVLPAHADGIYFQSFTELKTDTIDGVSIAEAVTAWVNGIADSFYREYPQIELQFGLHATSVKNRLDILKSVDKRLKIVWEDCGAFPYNYYPSQTAGTAETTAFMESVASLRESNDRFAALFKGMTTLYWKSFQYRDGAFVLGKASGRKIADVEADRTATWKYIQAQWIKNAEYVRKQTAFVAQTRKDQSEIQLLVEYGAFEKHIWFPVALAAEMMWCANDRTEASVERAMMNPYVYFGNL